MENNTLKIQIPDFLCNTCGNCEKNINKDSSNDSKIGFCYRFLETTPLEQKNLTCWTSKPHEYYQDLNKLSSKQKLKAFHIKEKRKEKLELNFENQLTLF